MKPAQNQISHLYVYYIIYLFPTNILYVIIPTLYKAAVLSVSQWDHKEEMKSEVGMNLIKSWEFFSESLYLYFECMSWCL